MDTQTPEATTNRETTIRPDAAGQLIGQHNSARKRRAALRYRKAHTARTFRYAMRQELRQLM